MGVAASPDDTLLAGLGDGKALRSLPVWGTPPSCLEVTCYVVRRLLGTLIFSPFFLLFFLLALLGRCCFGRDPASPRLSTVCKLVRLALFDKDAAESRSASERGRVVLNILLTALWAHSIWACCWYIDELCGCCGGWKSAEVIDPIFLISNGRTGSTEFGVKLYSVGDHLLAPCGLQNFMPYLWVWRLASCLGVSKSTVRAKAEEAMKKNCPEFHKRHRADPFYPDTFEIGYSMTSFTLGPGNVSASPNAPPYGIDASSIEQDAKQFCRFVDAILKKTVHFAGRPAGRRPFLKGHFLHAGPQLHAMYPSATFVNVVRDMGAVIQSLCNFMHVVPAWKPMCLSSPAWVWMRQYICRMSLIYCQQEVDFFAASDFSEQAPKCIVLQFEDYIRDLRGSLQKVFDFAGVPVTQEELDGAAESKVTTIKTQKEQYAINVSLDELGISQEWLRATFKEWNERLRGAAPSV